MNAIIRWMAVHPVAANLAMVTAIAIGLMSALALPQKTFPEFTLDQIDISVEYTGAAPDEIEASIIRPIEDQLSGIDGVDEITATATEGRGQVSVGLKLGEDVASKLDEIRTEVDRITIFPEQAEEPTVVQRSNRQRVLEIAVHGDASEAVLKEQAERLKDELVLLPSVSFAEVTNTRDYEVSIEIDRDTLNAYGLTLEQVARIVAANSIELPGGAIDTETVSIPLRTLGRNYSRQDFEEIVVLANDDTGARVHLRDIARVDDGFEDSDLAVSFEGTPMATVNVFRVGDEQVLDIVAEVKAHLADSFEPGLPDGLAVTLWQNDAEELRNRLDLLSKNAVIGLLLVVVCLALFLDIQLAVWSAAGIGIAFLGTFGVMALMGMSINMISLFGFILAIGIVVDNAIVVGENIYKNVEQGLPSRTAAIAGAQRVAVPVIFSTLTTVVAFTPLLQMPGTLGKFLGDIPTVVIVVLMLSLVQSLLILPRNLSRLDLTERRQNILLRGLNALRHGIDRGLQWLIQRPLDAMLRFMTRRWAVPIAGVIALMILTVGLLAHGFVRFSFFPSIDGKFVTADIEMVDGTTFERTRAVAGRVRRAAEAAGATLQAAQPAGTPPVTEGINVVIGKSPSTAGPTASAGKESAALAHVVVRLMDPEIRAFPAADFEAAWRDELGDIAGIRRLSISSTLVTAGAPVALEMSLPEGRDIRPVVDEVRSALAALPGVYDIRDDRSAGRLEYTLTLKPEARIWGLSLEDLARQMRNGFFGIEATRVQRGRDEVRVFVRLPDEQRDSVSDLLATQIRTERGDLIPLETVARIDEGLSPSEILRRDGRTITTVTADVDPAVITGQEANDYVKADLLPALLAAHDGLIVEFGGEQRTKGDAQSALGTALAVALFVIFALLALIFRSYAQPLVVMVAIPLGLIGAVTGHLIMGIPITLLSIFGIIGLAGVVINNSLVMIDLYNEYLERGDDTITAVIEGTKDRFRPILLTSLTTFLGVFPLIMETSLQAQFLIPLAVSIGFGVLFGTVIIVLAVPAFFIAQAKLFRNFRASEIAGEPIAADDSLPLFELRHAS